MVTIKGAPSTDQAGRTVNMTPTSGASVPDLRYWTAGPVEQTVKLPPEEGLGHELCGHAALMQARAHPPGEDATTARTFSDIHDPTIKIENALAGPGELALGSTPRGLAASSPKHRGESLRVFEVKPFTKDNATISPALQAIVDGGVAFADVNDTKLIDVIGFSDKTDTVANIGQKRADAVRTELDTKMKSSKTADFTTSSGAAQTTITRLQPASDGGVGSGALVEIRIAREPAGLVTLPAGVTLPKAVTPVGPETPAVVDAVIKKGKTTGNKCHDLLITTAWK